MNVYTFQIHGYSRDGNIRRINNLLYLIRHGYVRPKDLTRHINSLKKNGKSVWRAARKLASLEQ